MEHIIYDDTDISEEYQIECKQRIAENQEISIEEVTESQLWDEINENLTIQFQDEMINLDMELDGRIIAIAEMGLWNGKHSGYKILGTNLKDVLTNGNHDYIKIYSDGFNIRKKSIHHDGTNYILYRMVREDRNIDNLCDMIYSGKQISNNTLNYYTKSIEKPVRNVYGW